MLGPWVEKTRGDWRRYWLSYNGQDAGDLAAIVGTSALGLGWRTFSPEGTATPKWFREGGAKSLEEAKTRADEAIWTMYKVK
jgi:hypothetical protein